MNKTLAALAIAAVALPGIANAGLATCDASFTANGTAKVHDGTSDRMTAINGCEYLQYAQNDKKASISNINLQSAFGFTDWVDNGQTEINNSNKSSGLWSVVLPDFDNYDYVMVIKPGPGNGTMLTAYLLNEIYVSGVFGTPGGAAKLDSWTIAKRYNPMLVKSESPSPVPAPGGLPLFLMGVASLGYLVRRRREKAVAA